MHVCTCACARECVCVYTTTSQILFQQHEIHSSLPSVYIFTFFFNIEKRGPVFFKLNVCPIILYLTSMSNPSAAFDVLAHWPWPWRFPPQSGPCPVYLPLNMRAVPAKSSVQQGLGDREDTRVATTSIHYNFLLLHIFYFIKNLLSGMCIIQMLNLCYSVFKIIASHDSYLLYFSFAVSQNFSSIFSTSII